MPAQIKYRSDDPRYFLDPLDYWREFQKRALPRNASEFQRDEMRKAFYTGMWTITQELVKLLDSEAGLSGEDSDASFEQFQKLTETLDTWMQLGAK